ncbi:unnamed protein product [Paramecium pentaurelia]|uniref:Tubulin/FtsZ 2-layer sandwich domain-containing protein n=1 Tax=Paramecium pentaurelia TaxID=43138 RepID=A0A8S1X2Z5_9CILI|nr:unnamed protein product [Paramecium pentaurelia]
MNEKNVIYFIVIKLQYTIQGIPKMKNENKIINPLYISKYISNDFFLYSKRARQFKYQKKSISLRDILEHQDKDRDLFNNMNNNKKIRGIKNVNKDLYQKNKRIFFIDSTFKLSNMMIKYYLNHWKFLAHQLLYRNIVPKNIVNALNAAKSKSQVQFILDSTGTKYTINSQAPSVFSRG